VHAAYAVRGHDLLLRSAKGKYNDTYVLDINAFRDRTYIAEKGVKDLVKVVEEVRDIFRRVTSFDALNVVTQTKQEERQQRKDLYAQLRGETGNEEDGSP
jgi:hypothetical protein